MSRTIDQKHEGGSIVKPAELIEFRGHGNLTLHDRRVLNLLYENAGQRVCDDDKHRMAVADLRGTHKGGERVKDSIIRLMQTLVEVPTTDSNGKPATLRTALLASTTTTDDESDPDGEVTYTLSKELREIIKNSTVWGRIQSQVMFAFSSKYALALYELLQKRVNLSHVWEQEFDLDDFRKLMGVPNDTLTEFFNLNAKCIKPALLEVNALADHGVALEPLRRGKTVYAIKMRWWKKNREERDASYRELQRSKIGRLPRLKGTAEKITN
jgi:Initiator Replication protein